MSAKLEISRFKRGGRGSRVAGAFHGRRKHHHRREDFAVEGIQEAGRELSETFAKLRRRCKARKLVAAIRHCDARAVNSLLDRDCRVVCFFRRPGFDCVKICCGFGRRNTAVITFDICVRSAFYRCNGFGNGFF